MFCVLNVFYVPLYHRWVSYDRTTTWRKPPDFNLPFSNHLSVWHIKRDYVCTCISCGFRAHKWSPKMAHWRWGLGQTYIYICQRLINIHLDTFIDNFNKKTPNMALSCRDTGKCTRSAISLTCKVSLFWNSRALGLPSRVLKGTLPPVRGEISLYSSVQTAWSSFSAVIIPLVSLLYVVSQEAL